MSRLFLVVSVVFSLILAAGIFVIAAWKQAEFRRPLHFVQSTSAWDATMFDLWDEKAQFDLWDEKAQKEYFGITETAPLELPKAYQSLSFVQSILDGSVPTDPAQWNDEMQKEFFGNMPPEFHQKYLDVYAKLCEATAEYWKARAELFNVIHPLFKEEVEVMLQQREEAFRDPEKARRSLGEGFREYFDRYKEMLEGNYGVGDKRTGNYVGALFYVGVLFATHDDFYGYPDSLDPAKQTEFWNSLAEETLFLYDHTTEVFQQLTREYREMVIDFPQRIDTMTLEDLPPDLRQMIGFQSHWFPKSPLNDTQKKRILNDEPLFLSQSGSETIFGFSRSGVFSPFAAHKILKEARDAEREQWKIDATPELSKLGIDQAEVARWDGSLSLHPFIRTIAERCGGIDLESLQTTIDHGSMLPMLGFPGTRTALSNTHPALMALIQGEKDIVFSARRLSQSENSAYAGLYAKMLDADDYVAVPFAKDAFVFLQNRKNPIRNLTLKQFQGIFSGNYRTWKEVGGFGGNIVPFTRNESSGSEEIMQTLVMRNIPLHPIFKPQKLDSMSIVFTALENSPGGIAYSIYHYDRYMVFNANTRVMAVDGVFPNAETIASGEYPLVYECVLVHRKNPGEKVERFVRWLLSEEGQRLVRSVGYVPVLEFVD